MVSLVSLTVFPEAGTGYRLPLITTKRHITVSLVCLTVSLSLRLRFPIKTTLKAYHRGFCQVYCIPEVLFKKKIKRKETNKQTYLYDEYLKMT
jgi:hypothetical protein